MAFPFEQLPEHVPKLIVIIYKKNICHWFFILSYLFSAT
jgi:hypothetical protein